MKIRSNETIDPQVLNSVEWGYHTAIDLETASELIAGKFDNVTSVEVFRIDGRSFDYDSGQHEGTALVWFA